MSLKEDFLEALRSVKRDFIREPEQTAEDTASSVPEASIASTGMGVEVIPPVLAQDPPKAQEQPSPATWGEESGGSSAPASYQGEVEGYGAHNPIYHAASQPEPEQEPVYTTSRVEPEPDYPPPPSPPVEDSHRFDIDIDDIYSDERTVISKNTIIRGTLQTEDSVRVLGQVMGDIECKANIVVAGKVRGNTTASNAYVLGAQVDGNMLCDDTVSINDDSWIMGNIRAQQANIDGKIKGNIETRHTVSIGSASSIIGNISTDELEIKRGAFVNGQIIMYSPSRDVMDRFERFED